MGKDWNYTLLLVRSNNMKH